jgi:hypothetical protein
MYGGIRSKRSSRLLLGLALAVVALLATAGSASATSLSYTFDFGNQGWTQKQDVASATFLPAGFVAKGGNPGGHLSAVDTGEESGCPDASPCETLAFYSPFVPTLGANYGGTGSFDLRSADVNPEFGAELLLLPSGDTYLDGFIPESPGKSYHHLSIPLNETARVTGKLSWAVCPYAGGACSAASREQFQGLLGSSDVIAVIVDVGPNGTGETYDLDNVTLTDAPPQPPAPPGPPAKPKKKCKKKKKHGHHASAAKKCKKKKKKHRRAAVASFRG